MYSKSTAHLPKEPQWMSCRNKAYCMWELKLFLFWAVVGGVVWHDAGYPSSYRQRAIWLSPEFSRTTATCSALLALVSNFHYLRCCFLALLNAWKTTRVGIIVPHAKPCSDVVRFWYYETGLPSHEAIVLDISQFSYLHFEFCLCLLWLCSWHSSKESYSVISIGSPCLPTVLYKTRQKMTRSKERILIIYYHKKNHFSKNLLGESQLGFSSLESQSFLFSS